MQNDCLDGFSHDGLDAIVVGRRRELDVRSQPVRVLLVCADGWNAYPGSIRWAFREKVKETAGRGRACLRVWAQVCIAVVIKRTEKKRVVEITRKMVQGTLEQAQVLLSASHGGTVLNTAFLERDDTPTTRQLDA